MKRSILIFFCFLSLISCDKILKDKDEDSNSEVSTLEYLAGEDKDENGCIGSAGYVWSVLKNECIRVFEIGYRLNPREVNPDEAVVSAFVIFDNDKEKVELFLPNSEKSVLLVKDQEGIYKYDKYLFDAKDFILKIDNEIRFEAAKEELQNINDSAEEIE